MIIDCTVYDTFLFFTLSGLANINGSETITDTVSDKVVWV